MLEHHAFLEFLEPESGHVILLHLMGCRATRHVVIPSAARDL
jgi:hypothetical protein